MKRLLVSVFTICSLALVSCLDITEETNLKDDGSGTITQTNDMSALLGLVKQMGGAAEMEKMPLSNVDSSISMKEGVDSIANLTAAEREIVRGGSMRIKTNIKEDKLVLYITLPFKNPGEIPMVNKLATKVSGELLKDIMNEGGGAGGAMPMDQMPEQSTFNDYYKMEFSNGELTRKVDKDKYVGAESDEYFKGLKQAAAMGMEMKTTYVFNLPRPAQKAEGKKIKLSEDKKTVTLTGTMDEFFDDASVFEFKIKY